MVRAVVLREDTERVYQFILSYCAERGLPPTQREMAEGCFMARSSVIRHLDMLDAHGLIVRELGAARGVLLPKNPE
ncbi:MAG: helix-turn-helix domain-containing protein [Armatimonadetes bacterium]|nr:helix-turn-helix domain-containing protein [Anaerolineae bacterium]